MDSLVLQERFRLENLEDAGLVDKAERNLNKAAHKIVKDTMSSLRIQAVCDYYKRVKHQKMTKALGASKIYLTEEEYLQTEIGWLNKTNEAFRWLCHYWATEEFIDKSSRKRQNRGSADEVSHRYGVDGHTGLEQRMVSLRYLHFYKHHCD